MKKILFLFICANIAIHAQPEYSKIASMPGAFSRMGFGARGIGMGNALSAIPTGNIVSYYNPALSAFQEGNMVQTSYSVLSLDRSLNFINFTRKFDFYSRRDSSAERKPISSAGISVGIINSGVDDIQERDNQGYKSGDIAVSENQFFVAVSSRFSRKLAIGLSVKFYYFSLYKEESSTTLGLDLGALYSFSDYLHLSVMFSDLNAKYKWDTADLYEEKGNSVQNKFPTSKKIGLSYIFKEPSIVLAAEFESSNAESNYLRFGAEYRILDELTLRGGLDRLDIKNSDIPVRPSAGFSIYKFFGSILVGVDYAFAVEPYSINNQHIVGVNLKF
ncbi:MAG TPA: hypothetical protein VHO28_07225 [Ignavibacteriales bacterium]|nr:hypothetical protein [Ignavibacteriales bacterium]